MSRKYLIYGNSLFIQCACVLLPQWFDGCWFPRPHETYHVASRKFYEKEIFKSDFYYSHRLAKAVGKCCVLYIKDYLKYQPEVGVGSGCGLSYCVIYLDCRVFPMKMFSCVSQGT